MLDRTQSSVTTMGGYQEDDDVTVKQETHLRSLISRLDNDVHDVMHILREKYINFLLQSMYLDVSFPIEQAIVKAKASLAEIQGYVDEAEHGGKQAKQVSKDKENAPPSPARQTMDYINNVIAKLTTIQKIEEVMPNVKSDETRTVAAAIVEVDQLFRDLEQTEYYEPLNKVVAGIYSSYAIHKGRTMTYLVNKFHEMIQCSKPLDGRFFQLVVSREDIPSFNNDLEAMQILGILDAHLDEIVERLLNGMFARILDSTADAEHVFVIESLADQYVAALQDEIRKADTKNPVEIFKSLTVFLAYLHKSLKMYFVVETPLIEMIGKKMAPKLVDMLVKDLLATCIPSVNTPVEAYQTIINAAKEFDALLQELNFFEKETSTFDSCFIAKFEEINVGRRCLKIFTSAQECIADVSGDVVKVGSTLDESDDSSILYFEELKSSQSLKDDDYTRNEVLPKSLQFPRCKVPKSIQRLGDLFISTVRTAASCETQYATRRFLKTARNLITLFIMTYEKTHHDKIEADPLFAQMYLNQCHFLSHVVFMASLRLTPKIFNKFPDLEKECDLASLFSQLHQKKSSSNAA